MSQELRPPNELQIQANAWKAVWSALPALRRCFYHVPNESTYNNSQQASSGVVPGIQDMHLLCNGVAWLLELKDEKGRLSRAQKVVHSIHHRQGFYTFVFRNAKDIIAFCIHCDEGASKEEILAEWRPFLSEACDGSRYEEYLKDWQDHKKKR